MVNRFAWIVLLLAVMRVGDVEGVSPRTWRMTGVESWQTAERESVGVSSDGTLRLAAARTEVEGLSTFVVWDLLLDGDDVLAATGDDGILYRVSRSGTASEELRSPVATPARTPSAAQRWASPAP